MGLRKQSVAFGVDRLTVVGQENDFRNSQGKTPANIDLFLQLDTILCIEEAKKEVAIGFWHVPREYNGIADRLAKEASQNGDL